MANIFVYPSNWSRHKITVSIIQTRSLLKYPPPPPSSYKVNFFTDQLSLTILFRPQEHIQTCGDVVLKTFDELTVRLSLDSTNLQHKKLVFELVKPHIPGFSVVPDAEESKESKVEKVSKMEVDIVDSEVVQDKKRKEPTPNKSAKKKSKKK